MRTAVVGMAICSLAAAVACSSATSSGQATAGCVLSAADSALIGSQPLFRDCGVDRPARAVNTRIDFNPSSLPAGGPTCFRAEVQLVVDTNGRPEPGTIRVVSANAEGLATGIVNSAPGWTYTPALRNGAPVRQIVRERIRMATRVTVTTSAGRMTRESASPCR